MTAPRLAAPGGREAATGPQHGVLVVTQQGERHADRVIQRLEGAGCPVFRLDLDRLGTEQELRLRQTGSRVRGGLRCRRTGGELAWSQVAAVFRPPQGGAASGRTTHRSGGRAARGGAASLWRPGQAAEVLDLLEGVLGRACWLNDRASVRRARLLAVQQQVAADLGLRTPRTLVTDCREEALAFARACGPVRIEAIGGVAARPGSGPPAGESGQVVRPVELASVESFGEGGPVVLREEVLAAQRVWAVVVGDQVFAARLGPGGAGSPGPSGAGSASGPHRLPDLVQRRLIELSRRLNLKWSAVELRVTPWAEHLVERVWPQGPWLWVEDALSVDISGAVAGALIAPVQRLDRLERAREEQGPWVPPVMPSATGRAVR